MVTRAARIDMRLSKEQKEILERAAAIRGQDLTSFALGVLLKQAADIMAEHEIIAVSRRDLKALLRALDRPRRPNAALRAAFRRLKDVRES